jgi:hypothetical protein
MGRRIPHTHLVAATGMRVRNANLKVRPMGSGLAIWQCRCTFLATFATNTITYSKSHVATRPENACANPARTFVDDVNTSRANIVCVTATPAKAPAICVPMCASAERLRNEAPRERGTHAVS